MAFSHSPSESVDVALHKRNGLYQKIKAISHKIKKEQIIVLMDLQKHTLVIINGITGVELDRNSFVRPSRNYSSGLTEAKNIALLTIKLVSGRQFLVVMNC